MVFKKETERDKYIGSFTKMLETNLKEGLYYDVNISISITQTNSYRKPMANSQKDTEIMAWVGPDKGNPEKIMPNPEQRIGRATTRQNKEYLGLKE